MTIGRSSKVVNVTLDLTPTNTISRRHAEIVFRNGHGGADSHVLRDLASTNGVFVNDVKIMEQPLRHGDIIQFGGAADIPVGTRFGGCGSHVRYRFCNESVALPPESRKRRQPAKARPEPPSPQRPKTTAEAGRSSGRSSSSANGAAHAMEAPRSNPTGSRRGVAAKGATGKESSGKNGAGSARTRSNGGGEGANGDAQANAGLVERRGKGATAAAIATATTVEEVLRDAVCGLCSEVLLDARVLPCSHSFCRLCWADHIAEKGTTCPVCLRKFHSSERNPRRCSNLDLLITSFVHKLAGPEERQRWKTRQEHAKKRAELPPTAAAAPASGVMSPSLANGATTARARGASSSPSSASSPSPTVSHSRARCAGRGAKGETDARGNSRQGLPLGRGEDATRRGGNAGRGGGRLAAAAVVRCEGCNEVGHGFQECPHRSESAGEDSEEEDSEEDGQEIGDGEDSEDA